MSTDGTLDLEAVKKRFIESEEALRRVKEELEAVIAQRRRADAATATLEESGNAVQNFTVAVSTFLDQIARLTEQVTHAVERLDALLSGTDIERLRTDISSELEDHRSQLRHELEELRKRMDERSEALGADVKRVIDALPKRWRRRSDSTLSSTAARSGGGIAAGHR